MTLGFAIQAMRRRIVLILITVLVVTCAGFALGAAWPKTYTSHAQILLGLDIDGSDIDPQTANLYLKDRVATYAELVTADEVITSVADSAGLRPEALRERVVVTIVPETVVLEVSVSGGTPEEAVELTQAVSSRFRTQVSALNVKTGGPKILPAQLSRPQPATAPDQLHGPMLVGVSALVGLVIGVLLALVLALVEANRAAQRQPTAPYAAARLDTAPHDPAPHDPAPHNPAPHNPAPHNPAPHNPAPHNTGPLDAAPSRDAPVSVTRRNPTNRAAPGEVPIWE